MQFELEQSGKLSGKRSGKRSKLEQSRFESRRGLERRRLETIAVVELLGLASGQLVSRWLGTQLFLGVSQWECTQCTCPSRLEGCIQSSTRLRSSQSPSSHEEHTQHVGRLHTQ